MKLWDMEKLREVLVEQKPQDDMDRLAIRCFNRAMNGDALLSVLLDENNNDLELDSDEMIAILLGYAMGQFDRKDAISMGVITEDEDETLH